MFDTEDSAGDLEPGDARRAIGHEFGCLDRLTQLDRGSDRFAIIIVAHREHRVPLTAEALALLQALPRIKGTDLVFFAPQEGMLSDMSLSAVMRRMQASELKRLAEADKAAGIEPPTGPRGFVDARSGRAAVPHGLRSTFRDWAAEQGIDRDMAEMALAHSVGSEVERAYRRTDMVERRRALMEAWGQAVRGNTMQTNVVQFRGDSL